MFPMISCLEELRAAKKSLVNEGGVDERIFRTTGYQVGIMIEIPSAAMAADILAQSDFFSIGTRPLNILSRWTG